MLNNTNANNQVTYTNNIVRDSIYVNALLNLTQVGTATVKFNKFDSLDQQGGPGSCVLCAWGNPSQQANLDIQSNTFSNLTDDDGVPAININNAGGIVNANTFSNIHQYGILLADKLANLNITNNTFTNIINDAPGQPEPRLGDPDLRSAEHHGPGQHHREHVHGQLARGAGRERLRTGHDSGHVQGQPQRDHGQHRHGHLGRPDHARSVGGRQVQLVGRRGPTLPGVTTAPYLQSSNLNGPCTGGGPLPVVSIGNVSVIEGNSGITAGEHPGDAELRLRTSRHGQVRDRGRHGEGRAMPDYPAQSGTLTIPANTTSTVIPLGIFGGTTLEQNETLTVKLTAPTNATLGTSTGTITIRNDELPQVTLTGPSTGKVKEGEVGGYAIQLVQPYAYPLNLNAKTVNGTGITPGDFGGFNVTVTFAGPDARDRSWSTWR